MYRAHLMENISRRSPEYKTHLMENISRRLPKYWAHFKEFLSGSSAQAFELGTN